MRSTYLLLFSGAVVAAYVDESSKAVIIEGRETIIHLSSPKI